MRPLPQLLGEAPYTPSDPRPPREIEKSLRVTFRLPLAETNKLLRQCHAPHVLQEHRRYTPFRAFISESRFGEISDAFVTQQGLELGEDLLDWVQIGTVGRRKAEHPICAHIGQMAAGLPIGTLAGRYR